MQVVEAIIAKGRNEKDINGGGTICSVAKIKAFLIGKIAGQVLIYLSFKLAIYGILTVVLVQKKIPNWMQSLSESS